MLKRIYIALIVVLLTPALLFAQSTSTTLKAARQEYKSLRYAATIQLLEEDLSDHPGDIEAKEMIANSYRKVKNYDKAVYWYNELSKTKPIKPEWALYYAEALANVEDYESSEKWYRIYLSMVLKDDRASSFQKLYPQVDVFFKNRGDWKISYLNINTAASEYSPMYYKQGLIFTSNRKFNGMVKRVFDWDQSPFTDLYYVANLADIKPVNADSLMTVLRKDYNTKGEKRYRGNSDDTPPTSNDSRVLGTYDIKLLKDTLGNYLSAHIKVEPVAGSVNTKYNEGTAALLPDGSLIFTRNNYNNGKYGKSKEGINKLKLYTAKAPDWNDIEPFQYNNDQYSVGHPTVNKAGTLLIFASDMSGGIGGTDLYYCTRATASDKWDKPVNMGPVINTEGNEAFPTIYKDSILFFSSTGHPGLGGMDIFEVTLNGVKPLHSPVNLGAPINSSGDDFGIIRSDDGTTGYFSSNRNGSDDIYGFVYHPIKITLTGQVLDSLNNQPILNSTVSIQPKIGFQTDQSGKFTAVLSTETDYKIMATIAGYKTVSGIVSTKGIKADTTLNIILRPGKKILPPAFDCDSMRKELTADKIYYDLDKSYIRSDAHVAMARLIGILNSQPDVTVIIASYCDSRGSEQYNFRLSMRRSQAAWAYLIGHGIKADRIHLEYFGESDLVNMCADGVHCTEAEQQLNRRTEFFLSKDGKKVLKMDCDWIENEFSGAK